MIVRELNHIGLFVHDLDASIKFYRDILGGILIRDATSQDGKSRFVYAQIGVGVLELIRVAPDAATGFLHVAYLVQPDGLDSAYEKLSGEGFEFTVPPKTAASGNGRLAFFKDLSGATFELIQREEDIRKPAFKTDVIDSFDGVVINAPADKMDAIDSFYTAELGLERRGAGRYGILGDNLIVRPTGEAGIDSIALTAAPTAKDALTKAGIAFTDAGDGTFMVDGPDGEKLVFHTK